MKNPDDQVGEWWYAERDELRVRWSPVQLWLETVGHAYVSFVVCENPTYRDVENLLTALRIDFPEAWRER